MDRQSDPVRSPKRRAPTKVRRLTELLLVVLGISLILYPWLDRYIQERKQLELLTQWEHIRDQITHEEDYIPEYRVEHLSHHSSAREVQSSHQMPLLMEGEEVVGTISIGKIDLYEPVLSKTTEKTLNLGVASVVEYVQPGDYGNFVLAGHRSRTFGKQFNRLDELEQGDQIVLETLDNQYVYEVVSKFLVEPDGLFVLDQDESMRELTLITCEPIRNPTHRLIVKATLSQTITAEEQREVKPL
jgi:sortase A